jgi:hypothetical protein
MTCCRVAVEMDCKVRECAAREDVGGLYGFVVLCAYGGGRGGLPYCCGGQGDEVEAVVKLLLDVHRHVPFLEALRCPFGHRMDFCSVWLSLYLRRMRMMAQGIRCGCFD